MAEEPIVQMSVSSTEGTRGGSPAWIVSPKGTVDLATCERLAGQIGEVIGSGATMIVLDLGEVEFLDSSGIRVIVHAAREMEERDGKLLVENASGATQRVLEVTGILEHLRAQSS